MKKIMLAAVMAAGMALLFFGSVSAQSRDDNKGTPGIKAAQKRPDDAAMLTEAQKVTVKSILSKYSASALTAADAKAIHSAFRDAGLKGGPGLNEAVTSAGFNSDKLRDLDPPPGMQERDREERRDEQGEQVRPGAGQGGGPGKNKRRD